VKEDKTSYRVLVGDVPKIVETSDGLAGENLGLLVLVFNGSRPIFIA
jgi:hypothetical protein